MKDGRRSRARRVAVGGAVVAGAAATVGGAFAALHALRLARRAASFALRAATFRLHRRCPDCRSRIDARARVLDRSGTPIPGLFSAGECTGGVLGDVYVGSGNSYANCVVFGRVAGRSAVARAAEAGALR